MHSYINNVCVSWGFQNLMHNLYTRFLQFRVWNSTDSVNRTFHNSMIQRFNPYNLLTDKVARKVSWTIYRPFKKSEKSIGELEMNFP